MLLVLLFIIFKFFVSASYKVCRYFASLVPFLMFLSYGISCWIDAFDGVEYLCKVLLLLT